MTLLRSDGRRLRSKGRTQTGWWTLSRRRGRGWNRILDEVLLAIDCVRCDILYIIK